MWAHLWCPLQPTKYKHTEAATNAMQGLSWLWREPQKGNRSAAEGREGVTSSATAVETPVSTPQTPPPAQARTRKHPKLTSLPPERCVGVYTYVIKRLNRTGAGSKLSVSRRRFS